MADPYRDRPELPPLPPLTPEEEAALELQRRRERGADQVLPLAPPRPSRPVPLPLPGRGRPVEASPAGEWTLAPGRPVHG